LDAFLDPEALPLVAKNGANDREPADMNEDEGALLKFLGARLSAG
jgi:hypothetical protein